jgi:hypothetical protein
MQQRDAEVAKIKATPAPTMPIVDDDDPSGPIWESLHEANCFTTVTNFTEFELRALVQLSIPLHQQARRRGPQPKIGLADGWIVVLAFLKMGKNYAQLANYLRVAESTLHDTIHRMCPIIEATLNQRWLELRRRPVPLHNTDYSYIGLLCDSTSIQVLRPKGKFCDAKSYFDAKNWIYALKKEVAVMAAPPYYCLFIQDAYKGATHDYTIFTENYHQYTSYLAKTPEERNQLLADTRDKRWAILADNGYTGPAEETPEIRRIAILKPSQRHTQVQRTTNEELCRLRAPVEQFFGRLSKLWGAVGGTYILDHNSFDQIFKICALLTNEHIRFHQLEEIDYEFYQQYLSYRRSRQEARQKREREHQEHYRARKRSSKILAEMDSSTAR